MCDGPRKLTVAMDPAAVRGRLLRSCTPLALGRDDWFFTTAVTMQPERLPTHTDRGVWMTRICHTAGPGQWTRAHSRGHMGMHAGRDLAITTTGNFPEHVMFG